MKDEHANQDKANRDENPKAEAAPQAKHPSEEELGDEQLEANVNAGRATYLKYEL